MKVWHDDIRRPPDRSWTWARTNEAARFYLKNCPVSEISLDYDMGLSKFDPDNKEQIKLLVKDGFHRRGENGLALAKWLTRHPEYMPKKITIHSVNSPGRAEMAQVLRKQAPLMQWATNR